MPVTKYKDSPHYWRVIIGSSFTIIYFIVYYIANVFIARQLNSAGLYGEYSVAVSVMMILGVVLLLGQDQYVLQVVPQYCQKKKFSLLKGYLKAASFLFSIAFLISTISSAIFSLVYKHSYPNISIHPVWIGILFAPSVFSALFLINLITARGKYLLSVFLYRAIFPCLMLLLIFISSHLNYIGSLVFSLITGGCWLILAVSVLLLNRNLVPKMQEKVSEYEFSHWFFSAMPLWIRANFIYALNYFGIIALEILAVKEKYVGIFSAALQIAGLVTIWSVSVERYFFVLVVESIEDKQRVQEYLNIRAKFLLGTATTFALLLVIFSKQILGMFGAEYIAGQTAFFILIFGHYIHTVTNFSVFALQAYEYRKFLIYSQLFFLVLLIVLTLGFISLWGILGAALGFTVSVVTMSIYLYLTVYFKLGLRIL